MVLKILILALGAVISYFICSLNPAIELSKLVYGEDIRKKGSGNPGFTNFTRVYGLKWGWLVMVFDLLKGAVCAFATAYLYKRFGGGDFAFAASFAGAFAMAGHAFPAIYKFKGGKGFLVFESIVFVINPVCGALSFCVLCTFLFTTRYMSLSSLCAVFSAVVFLLIAGENLSVVLLCAVQALFVTLRHTENIVRLAKGRETKFYFKKKK